MCIWTLIWEKLQMHVPQILENVTLNEMVHLKINNWKDPEQ